MFINQQHETLSFIMSLPRSSVIIKVAHNPTCIFKVDKLGIQAVRLLLLSSIVYKYCNVVLVHRSEFLFSFSF